MGILALLTFLVAIGLFVRAFYAPWHVDVGGYFFVAFMSLILSLVFLAAWEGQRIVQFQNKCTKAGGIPFINERTRVCVKGESIPITID